jgi:hypothetical protein
MDVGIEFFKSHVEQARHLAVQRDTIALASVTGSGALMGALLKTEKLTRADLPYSLTLACLGLVAWLLCAKLYERFKLHGEIAELARNKLDPSLAHLRSQAERKIKARYPISFWLPVHYIWNCLFAVICLSGTWITFKILHL